MGSLSAASEKIEQRTGTLPSGTGYSTAERKVMSMEMERRRDSMFCPTPAPAAGAAVRDRIKRCAAVTAIAGGLAASLLSGGCASPGLPKAPSLQLPAVVTDLEATRRGDEVELQFAVPIQTTEGLPYRGSAVRANVCRAIDTGGCAGVAALAGVRLSVTGAGAPGGQHATLQDVLPAELRAGPARLLTYRVELSNERGRTAGFGEAAYSAAGASPAPVAGLRAEGSRQGVVVRWGQGGAELQDGSEVVLRRELVGGAAEAKGSKVDAERPNAGGTVPNGATDKTRRRGARRPAGIGSVKAAGSRGEPDMPGVVWLGTAPEGDPLRAGSPASAPAMRANGVLDDSAAVNSTYRYAAERQRTALLGGRTVTIQSVLSAPVEVTLRAVYPPPAPTDLAGTAFPLAPDASRAGVGQAGEMAVDLIWTPADDAKTVGYNVYREVLNESGAAGAERVKLTASPGRVPAFHEVLPADVGKAAKPRGLRYSVTAVDADGMESAPVAVVVGVGGR